jgi:hypothetical protein
MHSRNSLVRARNDRREQREKRQPAEQSSKSRDLKDAVKQLLLLRSLLVDAIAFYPQIIRSSRAPVAQLDRASDYGSEG